MTRAALLVLLASQGALAAGRVVYATQQTAYLDAGAREGLAAGGVIHLQHSGKCRIEALSDHHASCAVRGARPGELFALPAPPKAAAAPPPRAPVLPSQELQRQSRLLAASGRLPLVEFQAPAGVVRRTRVEARVLHGIWASASSRPWDQERVDAWSRGAPIGGGFALYADMSARYWSRRSGAVSARPDDKAQLYVWEAALRRDAPGAAFAVGRLRPFYAPGATPLDGAQVGFRSQGGSEVGVFGGGIPDLITTAPSTSSGTAGAYWRVQAGQTVLLRHEARVAVVSTPELGKRIEAEGVGQIAVGRALDIAADVRGAAGDFSGLDAARVDLMARPADHVSMSASFRYFGLRLPERDGPGALGLGGASRHGDAWVSWEAADWLALSARAGGDQDLTTSVERGFVGPEVALPRLFGSVGGLTLGYQEERGFDRGRTAWVQALVQRPAWLRLTATGSWSYTQDGAYDGDEVGLAVGAAADLSRNVALRLFVSSRLGGKTGPLTGPTTGGAAGSAEVSGRF